MKDFAAFKKVAIDAVKKAEVTILHYFHNQPPVETKVDKTPVTKADKEAEQIIVETIKRAFPSHGFLGEEFGEENQDAEFVWIIDPIDGTKSFIRGLGFFGTVLGLQYEGKIVLGISNMPIIDELLYASEIEKTTLNGKPVHVSKVNDLQSCFVNFNTNKFDNQKIINIMQKLTGSVMYIRGFADTYGYHLVATGRADVFFEFTAKPWDISAYQIIVQQAGGMFSDFSGDDRALGPTTLATNGLLHDQMLQIVQAA